MIPLIFAHLLASTLMGVDSERGPLFLGLVSCLGGWAALNLCFGLLLRWKPQPTTITMWDHSGAIALLGLHGWWCLHLDWTALGGSPLVAMAPFVAGLIIHWLAISLAAPGPWHPFAFMWQRARLGLLPVLAILALATPLMMILEGVLPTLAEASDLVLIGAFVLGSLLLPLIVLSLAPPLLAMLWRAKPMPEGALRDHLQSLCRNAGVEIGEILYWKGGKVPFLNAAIIGIIPRLRYVIFSEDLLKILNREQITAVMGHELGHAKYGHLPLYIVFLSLCSLAALWLEGFTFLGLQQVGLPIEDEILQAIAMVVTWGGLLLIGFGHVSRLCERQADVAGATLAGDPRHLAKALLTLAEVMGSPPTRRSWRHGSIASRVAFLENIRLDPGHVPWHHRRVMNMRLFLITLLIAGLMGSLLMGVPRQTLSSMREADPALARAISLAEGGDDQPLRRWLIDQDSAVSKEFAYAILRIVSNKQDPGAADRELGRNRHLFRPFLTVNTGSSRLNMIMLNTTVYALTACTEGPPDQADLDRITQDHLDKLAKEVGTPSKAEDFSDASHVADTIGCAYFALGDMDQALKWFEKAINYQEQVETDSENEESERWFRELLRARRAATMDPAIQRLPRTWEVIPSTADTSEDNSEQEPEEIITPTATAADGMSA